jgi:uncharacterized protein (DUF2249 family)
MLMKNTDTVTVDVRDDIRNGREPFSRIMKAVAALRPQEQLLLIAPFEPVPLVHALKKQGFTHTGQQIASGDWETLFTRELGAQPAETAPKVGPDGLHPGPALNPATVLEVDARGLEPPQPMAKILEALANLPANTDLRARTDRRPMHLYPHLEERGFTAETDEQSDGSFLTHIRPR